MNMITKGLLAATALVTLPSMAQAAVVVSNVSITVPNTTSGVYVNLVTGLTGISPSAVPGWDINAWGSTALSFFAPSTAGSGVVVTASGGGMAADLAAGTVINGSSFLKTGVATGELFRTTGNHVVGFAFTNESTGTINFGYARISTTGTTGFPATITQLVYENTGAALTVAGAAPGAVPEPATWAMMLVGFGAIGFAARRRANVTTQVKFA